MSENVLNEIVYTANCIIIAQLPIENSSEQGQYAENNRESVKLWAIMMQFAEALTVGWFVS